MIEQQAPKLNSNGTPSKVLPELRMTDRVEGVYECECILPKSKELYRISEHYLSHIIMSQTK